MDHKFLISTIIGIAALALLFPLVFHKPVEKLPPPPLIMGRHEGCIPCHDGMTGFSDSHTPQAIGCASCHLGNPFSLDKEEAHSGMLLIPGNLAQSKRTCGSKDCHLEITEKIHTSLMATGRGMVTVTRYVFAETDTPDGEGHLTRLGETGADSLLRGLCASCHLNQPKKEPEPVSQLFHGGGCLACHIQYDDQTKDDLDNYLADNILPKHHPALTVQITNDHCFGCHSRSGRISISYEGWHDTLTSPEDIPDSENFRQLEDERLLIKMTADFHHEKGLLCIDCHGWQETMGDGKSYNHQEEQVKITCKDCHFMGKGIITEWQNLSSMDHKILKLRKREEKSQRFQTTAKDSLPILNVIFDDDDTPVLIGKNSGKKHPLNPPVPICGEAIKGHDRLSCQSCHTAWAPHCIRCHTEYDTEAEGYDHLRHEWKNGGWVESIDRTDIPENYHADLPTLGVKGDRITTFIPGMVLTIDTDMSDNLMIFRRLYAPIDAHTTAKKGRSCTSCHNDPLALGYGRGDLRYIPQADGAGNWSFSPKYSLHPADNLPEDAWTGFLQTRTKDVSTRIDARPLNREEQIKILQVGACLTCHEDNPDNITIFYSNFEKSLQRVQAECVLPKWGLN